MRKEKIKTEDFTSKNRPNTRLKQFGDIFIHRFLELVKISLLQAVFAMPLLVTVVLDWILIRYIANNGLGANALFTVFLFTSISLIFTVAISFIGITGVFYCMKKLIYADGEFAASAFFIGMREEGKKGFVIGLLEGFSSGVMVLGLYFFFIFQPQVSPTVLGFGIAIVIIQFILMTMFTYYSLAQVTIYTNDLRSIFKNSILLMLVRFPFNILFMIIHPGIFIALISIMDITAYVGVGLSIFFSTFSYLIWMLGCVSAFDRYINKECFPDFYKKGLDTTEQQN